MKQLFTFLSALIISTSLLSQVPKTIVVEHFTNSRCSICAGRNPGLYTNLEQQQNTIHLAIHPSSPYPTCAFNQENPTENDGRANYYGVYGSTPQLVIQGEVISPSINFGSTTLFSPFQNQTSPASISVTENNSTSEVNLRIALHTEASNNLGELKLFVALKEDIVNYASPNGETVHYDVFKKSAFDIEGLSVNLNSIVGDSIIVNAIIPIESDWLNRNFSAIVILQEADSKAVVQATEFAVSFVVLSTEKIDNDVTIYPNPANEFVTIKATQNKLVQYQIYNALGSTIAAGNFNSTAKIETKSFPAGIYFIKIRTQDSEVTKRLYIQK
jgi:spore coat protein U-like protein